MVPVPLSATGRITDSPSGRCIQPYNQNAIQNERKELDSCKKEYMVEVAEEEKSSNNRGGDCGVKRDSDLCLPRRMKSCLNRDQQTATVTGGNP